MHLILSDIFSYIFGVWYGGLTDRYCLYMHPPPPTPIPPRALHFCFTWSVIEVNLAVIPWVMTIKI